MTEETKETIEESNAVSESRTNDSENANEATDQSDTVEIVEIKIKTPTGIVITLAAVVLTDPVGAIKQTLTEFQETCYFTNYSLSLDENIIVKDNKSLMNDFLEIGTYIRSSNDIVYMILNDYDIKEARANVKRLREIINNPPTSRITISSQTNKETESSEPEVDNNDIPNKKIELSFKFSDYYKESLFRNGSASLPNKYKKAVTSSIKSIQLSAWNPPPPYRKLQGDLCYIEITTTSDGVFYVTATTNGYFVNNSSKNAFDPKVSFIHNAFSHELFGLLISISNSFRNVWNQFIDNTVDNNKESTKPSNQIKALDTIATLYSEGKQDQVLITPQWNLPSEGLVESTHSADYNRLIDDLTNNFGVEEKGANREWNDEIQAFKDLNVETIQDRLTKARFSHKIISEFTEACKQLAVAILDGHISPLNYSDIKENHVYLYNGIFMSKAIDTKETFKICEGNEANRKAAGLDLLNQKLVSSLDIDGLSSVLTCLIDFKGERLVGQTMIPGILSPGANSARLMYGALEPNQRIRVKHQGLDIMKKIASKLHLSENQILACPALVQQEKVIENEIKNENKSTSILNRIDSEKNSPVRIDDDDEVVPITDEVIPHIGPIECKLIRGSDGRIYALDMLRLTPRDANFVKGIKGTGNIEANLLDKVDDNIAVVYVLRHELINAFIQFKLATLRQNILIEAANEYKNNKPNEVKDDTIEKVDDGNDNNNNDLSDFTISPEVADKFNSISIDDIKLSVNPNVFLPNIISNYDNEQQIKDEELVIEISNYLFKTILPLLIYQIRVGEITLLDNQSFVEILHENGVNIRYLGTLGKLCQQEEEEDVANTLLNKQRIHSMPLYILEIIEIEIIARIFKYLCRYYYNQSSQLKNSPSQLIVLMLNYLLGIGNDNATINTTDELVSKVNTNIDLLNDLTINSTNKNKKKKVKSNKNYDYLNLITSYSTIQIDVKQYLDSKKNFLNHVNELILGKYLYELKLVNKSNITQTFLSNRINKYALLRRICVLNGIRIHTRDYNFNTSNPFTINDIYNIIPLVKSCEPDVISNDIRDIIISSKNLLTNSTNLNTAFELAQEASILATQITGPVHKEVLLSYDLMCNILINAQDYNNALSISAKSLNLSIQLYGLDHHVTIQHHLQLGIIFMELQSYKQSIDHFHTVLYLLSVISNSLHPEYTNTYIYLGNVYKNITNYPISIDYYLEAKKSIFNLHKHGKLTEILAEAYINNGNLDEGLKEQRISHKLYQDILGLSNPLTNDSKFKLDKYRRAVTIRNVELAKQSISNGELKNDNKSKGNNE